ncbi:MAG TPA: type VI secretion system protein TssA [Polyangiales bacterium]|jgi:type VI secretion system protein ImpA|nr:type VI secretion system protein TssA [Polyangiales bacterium]
MVPLDLETLLAALSPQAPCGPNLDEEAGFYALVDAARCLPKERIVGPNDTADGPNWREIASTAQGFFSRTKDLRIAAALAKAQLRLSGIVGYSAGIRLTRELLDRYWDAVHPVIDPSDGDATMRVNALRELCDRNSVLLPLRSVTLLSVPSLGSFSFKDISAAADAARSGSSDVAHAKTEAALDNCETSHLQQLTAALQSSLDDLRSIETRVTDKLGSQQQSLRFDELTSLLAEMHRLLAARLSMREADANQNAVDHVATDQGVDMNMDGLTLQADAPSALKATGPVQIRSRSDVQRTLDLLCAYYERNEPSSPVPILLKRARRLSAMSFMEIVRDLTPAGTAELEVIRGPNEADNT